MKWGVRRYQNKDGSLTSAGRARYGSGKKVFVSGSSKTQDKNSRYYRKKLPDNIKSAIDSKMKNGDTILVGDAPGIDRQVQDYLKKNRYKHVTVYATGDEPRYSANKKWNTKLVDSKGYEPGTPEFNRQKDIAMTNDADEGIAVVLDKGGAKATRNNVDRLIEQNKNVDIYKLTGYNVNIRMNVDEFKKETMSRISAQQNITKLENSLHKISDLKSYNNREAMKDPKTRHEWRDAADLGLKVYEEDDEIKINRNNEKDLDSWRSWFLYEDQTIGKPEIAAMVNRGYNKKEILDILDTAKNTGYYGDTRPNNDFAAAVQFGAQEGYGLEYFTSRCFDVKKKR
jgi:hypothetical protein